MTYFTPERLPRKKGKYEINFPPTWINEGIRYKFYCWENGETNPTRIVNLTDDMEIKAIYEPISRERYVNHELFLLRKIEFSIELQKLDKKEDEVRELKIDVGSAYYYPPEDLLILKEPYEISEESPSFMLKRRLEECPTGKENWREYQDVCKDILTYALVPPLSAPLWEEETEDRIHRRDLIFHIPHEVADNFWKWIITTYSSLAIIVDCKNYSNELKQNDVVITSKYFSRKRLGLFGIIVTRKGLNPNAKETQKRLWLDDDKMILCLNDIDLIKILELRERGDEPYKVIDKEIRSFRQSL